MEVKTLRSEDARNSFRDMLDTAIAGGATIIERHGKPTAVVVSYSQWERQRRQWLAMIDQRVAEMNEGDYVTLEQLEADLQARDA